MATVYLAHDLRHDREVAIKVLRPELAATLGPQRFLLEIQIAARLTHPHILPLHDSGESGGFLYYVMPYVDGESLREKITREGELPWAEAVRILREVTDGLAYAHVHGVVHRDIKPENIMLSGRHALITDFGVAKALHEATGRQKLTTVGIALGTPAYMSPEQAAADAHTDHRADIYALGAVGYELLTGQPPFTGSSPQMVLTAHLTEAPKPVTDHRAAVPPALAATIMRCLEKKPADRWQTAGELLAQLELLATPGGGTTPVHTQPVPAAARPRRLWTVGLAALAVIVVAVGLLVRSRDSALPALGRQTRITDAPGLETEPVVSPDGRFIAYTAGPYFQSQVLVRQVSGGPAIDLTAGLPGRHGSPRWAPGGNELLFVTNEGRIRRVSRVSALGPPARPMVELETDDAIASAEWAPDGTRFAYDLGGTIFVVPSPGSAAKPLYVGTDPYAMSWSPDGRLIAFVESDNRTWHGVTGLANTAPSMVLVMPPEGGRVDTIAPRTALNLSPTWGPDSRTLYFISSRDGAKDVYRIRLASSGHPSEPAQRLTTGLNAHTIALSRDGRTLAFSTLTREANVWMLPLHPGATITDDGAVPVTTGAQVIERAQVSPDGRWLVYDSDRRGNSDIYRVRLDQTGAEPEPLTTDSANDYSAAISPDGRELLFHSLRTGNRDLWVMGIDGTNLRRVTHSPIEEYSGTWSPDGRSVAYYADSAARIWLGIVSRDAQGNWGTPELILPNTANPAWSPTGNRLAALHDSSLAVISLPDRTVRPILPVPRSFQQGTRQVVWARDGRIYFRLREPDGRLSLVSLSPEGGAPTTLVRPRDASRASVRADWFTDGRRLYFTISKYEGDVSTIEIR